jgi:hypothetical protein
MNTCLSTIYLKFSQLDSRIIRLALLTLTVIISRGIIVHLPIAGDVSG